MAETAAWLVDRVIPRVPVRQWVLSFPIPLRRKAHQRRLWRNSTVSFGSTAAVHDSHLSGNLRVRRIGPGSANSGH
jgi:hypothetical protein